MTLLANQAAKALYKALECPTGAVFRAQHSGEVPLITPSLRAQQILYRFRKELDDPDLLKIQIRLSPDDPDHELWLIKGEEE